MMMPGRIIESLQTDVTTRIYRLTSGFNEGLYLVANEPSLGMYRLQEHIQDSVPKIVQQKQTLKEVCQQVDGACFDMEYDTQTVRSMSRVTQFPAISENIKRAVELKTKLDELESSQRRLKSVKEHKVTPQLHADYGSIQDPHQVTVPTVVYSDQLLPSHHTQHKQTTQPVDDMLLPKRFD